MRCRNDWGRGAFALIAIGLLCGVVASAPEAASRDLIRYRGRLFPKRLKTRLAQWERKDARVESWADRYKARAKHYRIESSVPRFVLELEIKPFLDELYTTYSDVFRRDFGLSGRGANKKTILVFHGYRQYAENAQPGRVIPRSNPGFIRDGREVVAFYEETDPAVFYSTVFHEGAHQFVKNLLPGARIPLWLDEALAVYLEGCAYSRTSRKITVGHLPPDRLEDAQAALRTAVPEAGVSLPEKLFMHVPPARFGAREYALAWSFLYYVAHCDDGRHRKGFGRFVRALNGAGVKPVAKVFQKAVGKSLKEMEAGWRDYVLALKAPPSPRWVLLDVEGSAPGVDLSPGDRVWSIGGTRVRSYVEFEAAWTQRVDDGPTDWIVVRRSSDSTQAFVKTTVPAGCEMMISGSRSIRASHALTD